MKRVLSLLVVLAAACSSSQPQGGQPVGAAKAGSYTSDVGLQAIGVIPTATVHDSLRNKDLNISIEYPTRVGGPFPVIVFSPGYGGDASSYEPLASYWAENGYVVIRVAHADAGALRDIVRESVPNLAQPPPQQNRRRSQPQPQAAPAQPPPFRPNPMEAIWDKEREPQWRDRAADLKLVIDRLNPLKDQFPELRDKIDATRVGVAGHGYGAFIAMLIGGVQTFGNPPMQLGDSRVKAIIAMSPQGPAPNRDLTADSFASLHIPAMFMSGSQDRGAAESEDPKWRKEAYLDSPTGDKYWVLIQGARHTSFTGQSASAFDVQTSVVEQPSIRQSPNTVPVQPSTAVNSTAPAFFSDRTVFQKIKLTSLLFWETALKNATEARDLLVQDKLPSGLTLEKK